MTNTYQVAVEEIWQAPDPIVTVYQLTVEVIVPVGVPLNYLGSEIEQDFVY